MSLVLNPAEARQLERAANLLLANEVVAVPSETVYGLAGRASSEQALAKIFALKARPHFDPLIVHVTGAAQLAPLVRELTPLHEKLLRNFWPGPLTLLFKKSARVPDLCTAGSDWVAVRAPAHPVFQRLLQLTGEPLAAPSANRFGRISPTSVQDVLDELGPLGLLAVVDGGPCEWGIESTVVKVLSPARVEIVRLGSVVPDDLAATLGGGVEIVRRSTGSGAVLPPGEANTDEANTDESNTGEAKLNDAPGQLAAHYAPRTPLRYFADEQSFHREWTARSPRELSGFALLRVFPPSPLVTALNLDRSPSASTAWRAHRVLSEDSSDRVAAARLFATLRELDDCGATEIWAVAATEHGLGAAINDRLRRAAASRDLRRANHSG